MFNIHVRAMSFVKRWQIAPNFINQTLSDHSYFVALYTAELVEYTKWSDTDKLQAIRYALTHDLAEIRTGDIPSPVKTYIDKEGFDELENKILTNLLDENFDHSTTAWGLRALVKVADMIDEVMHMAFSVGMGNKLLQNQLASSMTRFELSCHKPEIVTLMGAQHTEMVISSVYSKVDEILEGKFYLPMKKGIDK